MRRIMMTFVCSVAVLGFAVVASAQDKAPAQAPTQKAPAQAPAPVQKAPAQAPVQKAPAPVQKVVQAPVQKCPTQKCCCQSPVQKGETKTAARGGFLGRYR